MMCPPSRDDALPNPDQTDAQHATNFAYMYGFPIYAYGLAVQGSPDAVTNSLIHQRTLTTPDDTWVVRPNIDTLYSRAFLDVSSSDLRLDIPEFRDRYWIWPFYDFYGSNIASIGSVGNDAAGSYLVRYDPNNIGIQTHKVQSPYRAYLNLPTPYAISLTRIIVQQNREDEHMVNDLQDKLVITPIARTEKPVAPALDLNIFRGLTYTPGELVTLEESVLKLTARFAKHNPPAVAEDRNWVPQLLAAAGIKDDGTFAQKPDTQLVIASAAANDAAKTLLANPKNLIDIGGGWTIKHSSIIGNYGSFYQARCQIAGVGYLALTQDQAVYPVYRYGRTVDLEPSQAAMFTFSSKPKVAAGGFWSLTAYSGAGHLIPNDIKHYALGDRSNLKFPGGTDLHQSNKDGVFHILVQPADITPPAEWVSNWLPAPSGGGAVSLSLRLYGADEMMTNGTYEYPKVEIINALMS